MKKIFTILSLIIVTLSGTAVAQTSILCEDFNDYDTTTAGANYHGWTLTYFSQFSFYTSTQSSGPSGPNSYKFGVDSATMISPDITGAASIQFWMKGNAATGGTLGQSTFYI